MKIIKYPSKDTWTEILKRPTFNLDLAQETVPGIMDAVRMKGDAAVKQYTEKFDRVSLSTYSVTQDEIRKAISEVSPELKKAIQVARENIDKFHSAQFIAKKVIETTPGVSCWQKQVPIERVGLYIPGGSAPLFSTVLMLGIPARLAGCREIILCTPPSRDGSIHPAILYTANLIGLTQIFKVGGIQSIAAMTFGTETIPKVSKIFGPGNSFVTAAKQYATIHGVAIDMPAGPSEVAIMADQSSVPSFIAADLLSQAEHGPDSQVILFTCESDLLPPILDALEKQLEALPRKDIAIKALENSRAIVLRTTDEMLEICNEYAPEHLIIALNNASETAEKVMNAGSVFIGNYAPESAGDYASGTNHALPTAGFAKSFSGVNLDSFMRKITFQKINAYGLFNIGPTIEIMAEAESLIAHKNAVSLRLKTIIAERKKDNNV